MPMKRFALACLLALCLCSCGKGNVLALDGQRASNEENIELENIINDAMTALKNLDMETFNDYTNNKQTMVTPWGGENVEYTLFGELSVEQHTDTENDSVYQLDKEIVKNLSWEILDMNRNGETAEIKLRITNLDMKGIFQKAGTDFEMIKEIKKIPPDHTKTAELDLKAEKQGGKWIVFIDLDFVNAVSADIWFVGTGFWACGLKDAAEENL